MHPDLERELARLRHAMRDLDKNVIKLSGVNNDLVAFNNSFGTLLTAINLQKTCIEIPVPSPPPPPKKMTPIVSIPPPQPRDSISPAIPLAPTVSKIPILKVNSSLPQKSDLPRPKPKHKSKLIPPQQSPPRLYNWPRGVRAKIPPKYQVPHEMAKLERVLFVLSDSLRGMSIGELVKASNISVIQAKEILQTLTKLEQIKCKREKQGFIYSRS